MLSNDRWSIVCLLARNDLGEMRMNYKNDDKFRDELTEMYHNPESMPTYKALQEIQDLHKRMDFHILDAVFLGEFNREED